MSYLFPASNPGPLNLVPYLLTSSWILTARDFSLYLPVVVILTPQNWQLRGCHLKDWKNLNSHPFETAAAAAAAKSLQSCPTPWDTIDGSPPGSPIPGILQERTLEWVAISFSNAWKWKVKVKLLSRVWLRDPMDYSLPGSSTHGCGKSTGVRLLVYYKQKLWHKRIIKIANYFNVYTEQIDTFIR